MQFKTRQSSYTHRKKIAGILGWRKRKSLDLAKNSLPWEKKPGRAHVSVTPFPFVFHTKNSELVWSCNCDFLSDNDRWDSVSSVNLERWVRKNPSALDSKKWENLEFFSTLISFTFMFFYSLPCSYITQHQLMRMWIFRCLYVLGLPSIRCFFPFPIYVPERSQSFSVCKQSWKPSDELIKTKSNTRSE